ncbi:MAG: triose-phosphate isomerase, partial [Oscillospiraceae bacterium]|nr:triose-phosphate isomerase [Oscillospiraceae bacterium]
VVSRQTKLGLAGFTPDEVKKTVIAYEPVWAIGTGKTATAVQAGEACGLIRGVIAGLYGKAVADAITIQYGGSMNAKNAAELLAQEDVDGGLIGGASLIAEDFGIIIKAAGE